MLRIDVIASDGCRTAAGSITAPAAFMVARSWSKVEFVMSTDVGRVLVSMVLVLRPDVFVAWALLISKFSSELSGAEPWSAVASSYMLALGMERLMIVKSWDKY